MLIFSYMLFMNCESSSLNIPHNFHAYLGIYYIKFNCDNYLGYVALGNFIYTLSAQKISFLANQKSEIWDIRN